MSRGRPWSRTLALATAAATVLAACAGSASAGLIASDQYIIGPGTYTAGTALKSQPSVGPSGGAIGFASGSTYSMGSGSANWIVNTGGLFPNNPNNAGEVSFSGFTGDSNVRSVARALTTVASTPPELWFSFTMSQDGTSTPLASPGYALAGFGNTVPPTLGATSGFLQGLFFGFAHDPGDPIGTPNADLVLRYRDTLGMTAGDVNVLGSGVSAQANAAYTIIARVDVNANGGSADLLTYWVNPTDTSSIASMDKTSLANNDGSAITTYSFQGTSSDLLRLNYSAQNWGGDGKSANFGDPTLGTTLADVAPAAVPEPASLMLVGLGLAGGLAPAILRRLRACRPD